MAPVHRAEHGHPFAVDDEVVGRVVDHLPVVTQSLEVAPEIVLGVHLLRELHTRRTGRERENADVVGHEVEPRLLVGPLALVPPGVHVLQASDVIRRSHEYPPTVTWISARGPIIRGRAAPSRAWRSPRHQVSISRRAPAAPSAGTAAGSRNATALAPASSGSRSSLPSDPPRR